ncbi:hypothetical protein K2X30_14450 [bacterium]|jgi:hypothetical protein|nr:hypothetical protein [bacterium]
MLWLLLFTWVQASYADRKDLDTPTSHFSYASPSPSEMLPLVTGTPSGVFVSVESDRGLVGAALHAATTDLLFLDTDDASQRFNRINVELLAHAATPEEYQRLRYAKESETWVEALGKGKTEFVRQAVAEKFKWWSKHLDRSSKEADPLRDPALYSKMHKMALDGRIRSRQMDPLNNVAELRKVADQLSSSGKKISVLDLGRQWSFHQGDKRIQGWVEGLRHALDSDRSVVLLNGQFNDVYEYVAISPQSFEEGYASRLVHHFSAGVIPKNLRTSARLSCSPFFGSLPEQI